MDVSGADDDVEVLLLVVLDEPLVLVVVTDADKDADVAGAAVVKDEA